MNGIGDPRNWSDCLDHGWKSDTQLVDYLEILGEYQMLPREILGVWELSEVIG